MEKRLTLYSSIWATILMLGLFLFSSLTDFHLPFLPDSNSSPGRGILWSPQNLVGKVIVLDPGHGGDDPGTIGVGPTTEAENVLAIAWELRNMLEKAGAEVIMTRYRDSTSAAAASGGQNEQLAARVATANRGSGQIYVSLHNDWNDNATVRGTSVHFYKPQDLALAESLQQSLVGQLKTVDLGVKRSNFYVLRNTNIPAALVEIGFLSNAQEAALLARPSYRLEVARGLLAGINDYFAGQH